MGGTCAQSKMAILAYSESAITYKPSTYTYQVISSDLVIEMYVTGKYFEQKLQAIISDNPWQLYGASEIMACNFH